MNKIWKYWLILPCLIFASSLLAQRAPQAFYMLVGTYTTGKSEGISVYKFDASDGSVQYVSTVKTPNPSYLVVAPDRRHVYAVNELNHKNNSGGGVTAFSFDRSTGVLTKINEQPSGGDDPCYITVDKTNHWVIVGNYSSGTVTVFPIRADGSLGSYTQRIQHEGSSVNSERQEGPHVHETVLTRDNAYLFVPDLGLDKVMIYRFDAKKGFLSPADPAFVEVEAGTGPRHIDFTPDGKHAYLLSEMGGSISAFRYTGKGHLDLLQNISALPPDYTGPVGSAEVTVSADGRFLYASNRDESNTLAVFHIDGKSGKLSLVQHQSTLGRSPRHFSLDPTGHYLFAENQNSDDIVIFRRDQATGRLTDSGKRLSIGNPVCIQWIPAP
ncbi:MAG TPA: lactonase family protein [Chitinophagaceae bacterium]|nr:lactonase family protein [Chitinophagaceae bacterium]